MKSNLISRLLNSKEFFSVNFCTVFLKFCGQSSRIGPKYINTERMSEFTTYMSKYREINYREIFFLQ